MAGCLVSPLIIVISARLMLSVLAAQNKYILGTIADINSLARE